MARQSKERSRGGWLMLLVAGVVALVSHAAAARAQSGACCPILTGAGTCTVVSSSSQCVFGSFRVGQTCTQACPVLRRCCIAGFCLLTTSCAGSSGSGTCSPNPCGGTFSGACCRSDGTCASSSLGACIGGFVLGASCSASPCALGACCQNDNSCVSLIASQCVGTYEVGATCATSACAIGACCRHSECVPTTRADCTGNHTFAGANTACGPINDCCPADHNLNQALSVQDIFSFLTGWFAANPSTDFDHNGTLGVSDIFGFLAAWFAGC